jgi:tetratricopeptide (TPR) repeat protein
LGNPKSPVFELSAGPVDCGKMFQYIAFNRRVAAEFSGGKAFMSQEKGDMGEEIALAEFKKGVALLRKGQSAEAYEHLRQAAELKEQNPYYLSFLGVSVGRAQRKWAAAMKLCETAISMKRNEPQLYLNLVDVYISAGRMEDAVETLDAALKYCSPDPRLQRARSSFGRRRPPVLGFLDRGHFLNQSLGKLRYRLTKPLGKSQSGSRSPARFRHVSGQVELR